MPKNLTQSIIKGLAQKKRKNGEGKRKAITEEVTKLMKVGFIQEIKYPTLLSNVPEENGICV